MDIVPIHLAVTPDGNRRWARERGLPTLEGHRRGLDQAKKVALAAFDRGVQYFTMYAFSTENWNRTHEEVGYLMDLFHGLLTRELREFTDCGVRLRVLGRREGLPPKLRKAIEAAETETAENTRGTVCLCLNYGGQAEITDAVQSLIKEGIAAESVTAEVIANHLYAPEVPPIDLVIRTSGERRLSNFMLWRAAYAELYFVDAYWPAFGVEDLDRALADYSARQRRFGA